MSTIDELTAAHLEAQAAYQQAQKISDDAGAAMLRAQCRERVEKTPGTPQTVFFCTLGVDHPGRHGQHPLFG